MPPLSAAMAIAATLGFWLVTYHRAHQRTWWALTYPLGALVLLAIALTAIARGQRVEWRGREYVSRRGETEPAPPELGRVA